MHCRLLKPAALPSKAGDRDSPHHGFLLVAAMLSCHHHHPHLLNTSQGPVRQTPIGKVINALSAVCGGLIHCSWSAWQVPAAVKDSAANFCAEKVDFLPWDDCVPQNVCGAEQRKLQKHRSPRKGQEGAASFHSLCWMCSSALGHMCSGEAAAAARGSPGPRSPH